MTIPKENWIITISGYGSFGFIGTKRQAEDRRDAKAEWEGGSGRVRLAKDTPADNAMIERAKSRK